ncbi:hypothetical protein KPH14_011861 [Odynerus spinipes]|uniref:Uncharacterized protein n=1 Tax=Odynerus spinipes TaxID=1348599 RepID=A0AAD9RDV5_9HYME|nr:hypothetical protein KPH14_011861 [Odynerus spinipes]
MKLIGNARDLRPQKTDEEIVQILSKHFNQVIDETEIAQNINIIDAFLALLNRWDNRGAINRPQIPWVEEIGRERISRSSPREYRTANNRTGHRAWPSTSRGNNPPEERSNKDRTKANQSASYSKEKEKSAMQKVRMTRVQDEVEIEELSEDDEVRTGNGETDFVIRN